MRDTKVENPSSFPRLLISRYCGIYGTTPPNIMAPEAIQDTRVRNQSGIVIAKIF